MMTYEKQYTEAGCVLRIAGEVDVTDTEHLQEVERDMRGRRNIIVDVQKLRYSDTTFLRFLLRLRERTHGTAGGSVRVVGANRTMRRVLEVTGLSRYFCSQS